jgi:hypothetical protein
VEPLYWRTDAFTKTVFSRVAFEKPNSKASQKWRKALPMPFPQRTAIIFLRLQHGFGKRLAEVVEGPGAAQAMIFGIVIATEFAKNSDTECPKVERLCVFRCQIFKSNSCCADSRRKDKMES